MSAAPSPTPSTANPPNTAAPIKPVPRRSARFCAAPSSPGRRCEPCHREKLPDPSSLKAQVEAQIKNETRTHQGFYSKASLDLYLKKSSIEPRKARRRRLRKKVSWSRTLEW